MNLHVVAYPELNADDFLRIQECRKEHNSLYTIIPPHFTLVFAVKDVSEIDFVSEIKRKTDSIKPISFCLRSATINRDAISGYYDAFLVPDEGYGAISKLHDRLYSGKLLPEWRMDIPYVPHISIACNTDPNKILTIVNEWNSREFAIEGKIRYLDIINYENRRVETLTRIELCR